MAFLTRLTIARRLSSLLVLVLLGLAILLTAMLVSERSMLTAERSNAVRDAVTVAEGVVRYYHDLAQKGEIQEDDAKLQAMAAVQALRYSGNEYFFITDMQTVPLMNPFAPKMIGHSQAETKDAYGKRFFVEFADTVKRDGKGFVTYHWPKPGGDKPVEKISYVAGFAPWGWVIGSGVYMDNIQATFIKRMMQASGLTACIVLFMLIANWLIGRSILRELGAEPGRLNTTAQEIARGNLLARIDENVPANSIAGHVEGMRASVARIVVDVRRNADAVAHAIREIEQGNLDLSARTESQASAIEETAASMEQLTATVQLNANSARDASRLAQGASEVALQSGKVVDRLVSSMRGIQESSSKIEEIIGTIDGISFQTNILALNAAVEAARAGEQGKGFAVVAGEVRTLAQRSADAAREVRKLIEASVAQVAEGTQLAGKAGTTMQEVVASIRQVTDTVGEISAASMEQSTSVGQVGQAMTQMEQVTQQNAALVEEMAAAAGSLGRQARDLVDTVAVFRIDTTQKELVEVNSSTPARSDGAPARKATATKLAVTTRSGGRAAGKRLSVPA